MSARMATGAQAIDVATASLETRSASASIFYARNAHSMVDCDLHTYIYRYIYIYIDERILMLPAAVRLSWRCAASDSDRVVVCPFFQRNDS